MSARLAGPTYREGLIRDTFPREHSHATTAK
eukprot:SAG25_NODE_10018_length_348_cov_1.216867_1_plen_30_part_01